MVTNRYQNAANTLVLDRSHVVGIERGRLGQEYVAKLLGVELLPEGSPFDLRAGDGTRVDVKTSSWDKPLMVPVKQQYKLNPDRTDALILVWDGPRYRMVGQCSVVDFVRKMSSATPAEDSRFKVATLYVEADAIEPVPAEWVRGVFVKEIACCRCGSVTVVHALGMGTMPAGDAYVGSCCRRKDE